MSKKNCVMARVAPASILRFRLSISASIDPAVGMPFRIRRDTELEVDSRLQAGHQIRGVREATRMRLVAVPMPAAGSPRSATMWRTPGVPVLARDVEDLLAGRRTQVRCAAGAERGLVEDAPHGGVRALARRATGTVGHRHETRRQRSEPFDGAPELCLHLFRLRREELERDTELARGGSIEDRGAHADAVGSGRVQSQMTTVSGAPCRRAASRARRPAAAHQWAMSSVAKPSRR